MASEYSLIASSNLEVLKATLPLSLSSSASIVESSCFFSGKVFSVGVFEPLDEALVVAEGVGMFTGLATEGPGDGDAAALVLPVGLLPFFFLGIVNDGQARLAIQNRLALSREGHRPRCLHYHKSSNQG